MNEYVVYYAVLIAFLALLVVVARQYYKLRAWNLVFTKLTNAERVLLLWPNHPKGAVGSLRHDNDGKHERLVFGSQPVAKLPVETAAEGRKRLQALLDSST